MTVARYTSGLLVDQWISLKQSRLTNYYHQDGLNSVVGLTDVNAMIAARYRYDAFGAITSETASLVNPFTYTGRRIEADRSLYDYRSRFYDGDTGRFLSKDLFRGVLQVPQRFILTSMLATIRSL